MVSCLVLASAGGYISAGNITLLLDGDRPPRCLSLNPSISVQPFRDGVPRTRHRMPGAGPALSYTLTLQLFPVSFFWPILYTSCLLPFAAGRRAEAFTELPTLVPGALSQVVYADCANSSNDPAQSAFTSICQLRISSAIRLTGFGPLSFLRLLCLHPPKEFCVVCKCCHPNATGLAPAQLFADNPSVCRGGMPGSLGLQGHRYGLDTRHEGRCPLTPVSSGASAAEGRALALSKQLSTHIWRQIVRGAQHTA